MFGFGVACLLYLLVIECLLLMSGCLDLPFWVVF